MTRLVSQSFTWKYLSLGSKWQRLIDCFPIWPQIPKWLSWNVFLCACASAYILLLLSFWVLNTWMHLYTCSNFNQAVLPREYKLISLKFLHHSDQDFLIKCGRIRTKHNKLGQTECRANNDLVTISLVAILTYKNKRKERDKFSMEDICFSAVAVWNKVWLTDGRTNK